MDRVTNEEVHRRAGIESQLASSAMAILVERMREY